MLTFHNDPAIKAKYLSRVIAHQNTDNLVRGIGWEDGKGCAVGCTLENYDHSRYPIELGIPEWLARLEDTLFEGMSLDKSKTWPEKFLAAIPVGITEEQLEKQIKAPFMIAVLESTLVTLDHAKYPDVKAAVEGSIALWKRDDIGSDDWKAAASATWAAASAATWAAASAATRAAASAATWAATWAAARAASYDHFADALLNTFNTLQSGE